MKIQLLSDLHLEMYKDLGESMLKGIPVTGDILVLAGDITKAKMAHQEVLWENIKDKWSHVIYVAGNHEYYFSQIRYGSQFLKYFTKKYENIHFLDNEHIEIGGITFYAGTGWFPREQDRSVRKFISDFGLISDVDPEAYYSNQVFKENLKSGADVIITHHLPCQEVVIDKWKGNVLNCFFVSEFDPSWANKLWLYGHTHDATENVIGNTKLVCNPHGYPRERALLEPYNFGFIIEV